MKLTQLGAISTGIVVILSIALVVPAFTHKQKQTIQQVLLSFSVIEDRGDLAEWCNGLSSVVAEYDAKAVIFFTGKVAETHPECISAFSDNTSIDIGSQTYSYIDLTTVGYESALEEVRNGKLAVDRAGNLTSKVFRAPYGSTDENIYSLLNRSGIFADFSYKEQYNWYQKNQFVKFDMAGYAWSEELADFLASMPPTEVPIMINFDNSISIEEIDNFISVVSSDQDLKLVNASDLTGKDLTVRRWLN